MMKTLTHRILTLYPRELQLFRSQVFSLDQLLIPAEGWDSAATAMERRPALATPGVSVDLVGFNCNRCRGPEGGACLSVAMRLQPDRRASSVHWEEAHAWADAVAGGVWPAAEFVAGQESWWGRAFHYALAETYSGGRIAGPAR